MSQKHENGAAAAGAAYEQITYAVADRIATITLNRPEARNGYTTHMAGEIADALRTADTDHEVRVVVLTGAGKDFCVGADLAAGKGKGFNTQQSAELAAQVEAGEYQEPAGTVTRVLYAMNKPVIAAVRGAAVGVGSTMLLPADYRLASKDCKFGFPFTRRGIVPEGASAWFLPRLVGMGTAMDWLVSGRILKADEALRAGLVNSLHDPDEVLDAAYELAAELVVHTAPVSVALVRQLVYRMAWADSPEQVHRLDSRLVFDTVRGADAKEGVTSFFERRAPEFPGRVPEDLPAYLPWAGEQSGT
ncbi:enoyl-CoA hydratase-related protein [Streptomyces sp. BE230]|uniref:enoyl-CoA hydratase-related protein n=1 Tax=Streptomyces sp. BE230 TaxID=3002526 RepID=UPI002ED41A42|nr:enoyl-CoA hydratase-related protein [Streptomyces sp. BE230]